MAKPDVDVAILSGGPARSAMAAYLARAGIDCIGLEREIFPRPHVGESLRGAGPRGDATANAFVGVPPTGRRPPVPADARLANPSAPA